MKYAWTLCFQLFGFLFVSAVLAPQAVQSEDWAYVGKYQDGAVDYFDRDSLKRQGNTVFSRYKTVLPAPVVLDDGLSYQTIISESKEDCQAKTSVTLIVRGFTLGGKEVFSQNYTEPKASPLAPGSNGEFYQNMICAPNHLSKQKLEQLTGL